MTYVTAVELHNLAREVADAITADARTVEGPVVWITGNSYMPPMRSITQAEYVWQADNNDDGELFASFTELVEKHLANANVYLGCPEYDNALYAVDMNRWQFRDTNEYIEDLNDEWERI